MCILTKATSIQFIDGKCHIKKRKSCKTALSGYYACVSRDLLLMPSGADTHTHTHTHTYTRTCTHTHTHTHTHARKHTDVRRRNDFKKPGMRGPAACTPALTNKLELNKCLKGSMDQSLVH